MKTRIISEVATEQHTPKAIKGRLVLIATPIFLYLFLVINGLMGINFGSHWDEHLFVEFADDFHFNGRIIPTNYLYPSFCYFLTLAASVVFRFVYRIPTDVSLIQNLQFSLFSREIYVCVASLCVVWVFILTFRITKKYSFAAIAGLIFCASFEFSYHSRWAVTDLIAVQFAFLSTIILFLDIKMPQRIILSAFVAGIATGTKYTAGIVCLNILINLVVWITGMEKNVQKRLLVRYLVCIGFVFCFAFVLTTPGCIYHLKTFVGGIFAQKKLYGSGHLLCDTVGSGLPHFSKLSVYIIFSLFSKYALASAVISMLVFVGTFHSIRKGQWQIFGLFLVMFIYIIYVASFSVLIVRNDLYVLPYFVTLAAYGIYALHEYIKNKFFVRIVDTLLAFVIVFSLFGVARASWSIYTMNSINSKDDLAIFLKKHPEKNYVFSTRIQADLPTGYVTELQPTNGTVCVVFFKNEVDVNDFSPIGFRRYELISGPQDVNLNYYPEWSGADRIMLIRFRDANPRLLADIKTR